MPLRLAILLLALALQAQQKPLFEVEAKETLLHNGFELTYTLVNNTGLPITGVEIMTHALPNNGGSGVKVNKFPNGTDLSSKRIPLPSAGSFISTEPNYKPAYKIQIVSVTFADGSTWHGPPHEAKSKID